jgi:hypothetical protein
MEMDALSQSIASLSLNNSEKSIYDYSNFVNQLKHDILVIIECNEKKMMSLDRSKLLLKKQSYHDESTICAIFQKIIELHVFPDIVEVMPYIDEYLEYFDQT